MSRSTACATRATRACCSNADDVVIVASRLLHLRHRLGRKPMPDMTLTYPQRPASSNRSIAIDVRAPFGRTAIQTQRSRTSPSGHLPRPRRHARNLPSPSRRYRAWRLSMFGDEVEDILGLRSADRARKATNSTRSSLYPNSHYVTPKPTLRAGSQEHQDRIEGARGSELAFFRDRTQLLEARTPRTTHQRFDLEMILRPPAPAPGIENYSRYLTGRAPGEPPPTLFEYIPPKMRILFRR